MPRERRPYKSRNLKRTIKIDGRLTSVALEEAYWRSLREIANARKTSLFGLITEIDRQREHVNLASELRHFCLNYFRDRAGFPPIKK